MSASHKSRGKSSKAGQARPPGKPLKINRTMLLLGCIMLLGLVVRLLPALYCIIDGRVIFLGPDSYYHMRRAVYTVFHYPYTNFFDSYVDYPYGFLIAWPPLFDVIIATAALLAGLGHPDTFTIELAASVVLPLMGMATIALVYYFVKDAINEKAALISALLFAILPAGVFRSIFGLVDHHALEVLISLAMYLLFMRAVSGAKKAGLSASSVNHARPLIYAAMAGVATACAILSWDGAPIFVSVIAAYAFVQYAYDALNKESSDYLAIVGAIAFLTALIIVAPMALTNNIDQELAFSAMHLSWFHVIYLLSIALFFLAMGWLSRALQKHNAPWYSLPVIAIAIGIAALVVLSLTLPDFFYSIKMGFIFLSGLNKVMSTISEVEPLFITGGRLSLALPWAFFSVAGPIALLGLLAYLLTLKKRKLRHIEVFLLVSTAIVLVLGLMQKRFINILAVNASIFAGYALYSGLELAGLEQYLHPSDKKKPSASRSGSISATLMAACIIAVLLLVPVLLNSISLAVSPEFYTLDWNNACTWVEANTPKTSFLYSADPGTCPEYGIMSWWDYGNYILYKAERPAIANNFQTGVEDAASFFIAQDEASANAIMDNRNAKYVMLDYRMGTPYLGVRYGIFEDMAYLAGEDPYSYHSNTTVNITMSANMKYFNTIYSRLFNMDGCGGNVSGSPIDSLEHYRLLYFTWGVDPVKVFEYVKGAVITGNADPGSTVEMRLKLTSPYGVKIYYSHTMVGQDGRYTFIVPYSTASSSYIRTGAAYSITCGPLSASAAVPESAVQAGDTIQASWARLPG